MRRNTDLFNPIVSENELHPDFKLLMQNDEYAPARGLIQEIFNSFLDKDGHFIREFQTQFHPRIWELYLHSYLVNSGFAIDPTHKSPDFIATKSGITLCIEAVTANPTQGSHPYEISEDEFEDYDSYILYLTQNIIPIKLGGPLSDKLMKKYWELPHVAGLPLILAIEDFHETNSHFFNSDSLRIYLYGVGWKLERNYKGNPTVKPQKIIFHEHAHKKIPSGFFWQEEAKYISAVIFNNLGDVEKFNRMGHQGKYRSNKLRIGRKGVCISFKKLCEFSSEVGDPNFPFETWGQGMEIFHNPNALNPIPPIVFSDAAQWRFKDGGLQTIIPSFHPLSSITYRIIS
ncbi:MAG: glycosaminoglycan attachment protein [Thermodesulfobacteriota bacterium]